MTRYTIPRAGKRLRDTSSLAPLRYVLPIAGALATGALGIAAYTTHTMNGPRRGDPLGAFSFTPWEVQVPFESVEFAAQDGVTLRGWWFPSTVSDRVIVGFTGHKGVKQDLLGISSALWRAGNNILLFDFRGCGESDLVPLSLGYNELPDARAALRYARHRVPHGSLGVIGYSMGAAIAILTAAETPEVRAVVADSSFASIHDVLVHAHGRYRLPVGFTVGVTDLFNRVRYGYRFDAVRPIDAIDRIAPRPLLLIHGGADGLVPVDNAHRLARAAGPEAELWIVPEARHCGAYFSGRDEYVRRVGDFFARSLPPRHEPARDGTSESRTSGRLYGS